MWQGNAVEMVFFAGGIKYLVFSWQRGTLQSIEIHLITLHNILEYIQIAIIETETADFVKMNICIIFKTFGKKCSFEKWVQTRSEDHWRPMHIGLSSGVEDL